MSSKILMPIVCAVFPVLIFTTGCMTGRTTRQSSTFNTVHDNILSRPLNEGSKPIARRSGNVAMESFLDNSDETTARFAPVISDSNSPESSINPTRNDYSAPVMTLAEFESLALDNNPTIQELAATTQRPLDSGLKSVCALTRRLDIKLSNWPTLEPISIWHSLIKSLSGVASLT